MSKVKKFCFCKVGLVFGILVYIGEIKIEVFGFLVIDFDEQGFFEVLLLDMMSFCDCFCQFKICWVNVYGVQKLVDFVVFGYIYVFYLLVQEDIFNNVQCQKIDVYDDYFYFVFYCYDLKLVLFEFSQDQISLVIGCDFVLSFQERQLRIFELVCQCLCVEYISLCKGGVDMLVYLMIDLVVDGYFVVIE